VRRRSPTEAQIDADLKLLVRHHQCGSHLQHHSEGLDVVPALAATARHQRRTRHLARQARRNRNQEEIANAIRLARTHKNVVRVIIGNEVVLRGDVPIEEMYEYLDRAREQIGQPVSTAEPWHVWVKHPKLADHVDFIAVHLLPYWEGVEVEQRRRVSRSNDRRSCSAAFPGKPIVIGEVGWPSNGRTRESAVASEANQALFLRRFLAHASREGWIYYVMEAFDQPWKARSKARSVRTGASTTSSASRSSRSSIPSCGCRNGARPRAAVGDRRAVRARRDVPEQPHAAARAAAASSPWSCTRRRRRRSGSSTTTQQYLTLTSVLGLAAVHRHARRDRGAVHRGA
jgi:exo-beta-1,3-glucanase (GH17 family)